MSLELQARWSRINVRLQERQKQIADRFDSVWLPRVAEFGTWCFEHPRKTAGIMLGMAAGGAMLGYLVGRIAG